MDEPVTHFEEIKEFEFEIFGYLDNSIPHPPPKEPISLEENFDNIYDNSTMVPLTCSSSTSQPKDEFVKFLVIIRFLFNLLYNHRIYRITERNKITRYTTFILGNPHGEENPTKNSLI
jgi:hypothetical protein